jgi:taurine--2-oxoglutarate transaminase
MTAEMQAPTTAPSVDHLVRLDREHVMHNWAVQAEYTPEFIVRADGNYVWSAAGDRYLDFTAQQWHASVGHNNQAVLGAIKDAVNDLAAISSFATPPRAKLAEKLLSLLPAGYSRIFFGSNGSDANEAAIKTARMVTGRQGVISFWNAYHGASMAATSATGLPYLRTGFGQPVPGHYYVPAPYHYRSPIAGRDQDETDSNTIEYIRRTIEQIGPETIAAIIGEPFNATAGIIPGWTFWSGLREVCDEHGILLIGDEVVTGFGRSGTWFARDQFAYEPDVIVLAKGLTSGYLPLSAAVFHRRVTEKVDTELWAHGLTYAGHPVCCAAALANIAAIEEQGLIAHAAEMGEHLRQGLSTLKADHPSVGDVRCMGLYGAIELVANRSTKTPFPAETRIEPGDAPAKGVALEIGDILKRRGILVNAMRVEGIVKCSPPLTIQRDEIDLVLEELDRVLGQLDRFVEG